MVDPTRLGTSDPNQVAAEDTRSSADRVGSEDDPAATRHASPDQARDPVAARLSPPGYALQTEIGRGGMGVVYRARDTSLNRDVAVKILQEKYAARSFAANRFLEEARITGQLQHPGIPPIHAMGLLPDGRPFLAMKLIKGRTLDEILRDPQPANCGTLIAAFEQICQAMAYAHNRGVIHRDLKPHNVMVGAFGEIQVMDWGLAKFRAESGPAAPNESAASSFQDPRDDSDDGSRTRAGSFLGTPAYMSPEQALGAIESINERSDVFGLGGVLCAILTGEPPFWGETSESTRVQAAEGNLQAAFARLDACGADADLVALCKRCLAAKPAARLANAGEVAQAVAEFRAAAVERARQAELDRVRTEGEVAKAEAETREQRKRRRVQLALAACASLLLLAGVAFAWYFDRQSTERRNELANKEQDEREWQERNNDAMAVTLAKCEEALQADDSATAALMLEQARKHQAEGCAEHLAARLQHREADLAILRELDAIDIFRWTSDGRGFPNEEAQADRIREGFSRFRIVPGDTTVEDAANRLRGSKVRDRMIVTLDRWLRAEPREPLRAILRSADSNTFRDAVRDTLMKPEGRTRLQQLAERAEALEQPTDFIEFLGECESIPAIRSRVLLQAALTRRPGDLGVLMSLGMSYSIDRREGADERVRWFQAAALMHPDNSAAHNSLGTALRDKGDLDGAITEFRHAIRLHPDGPFAFNNLGLALTAKGDTDDAITALNEAIRLAPKDPVPRINLGVALAGKGNSDGASASYREAIRLGSKKPELPFNIGVALKAKGDIVGAIAAYREAIQFDPKFAPAHNNLGDALKAKGDVDGAIAAYRESIHLDPASPYPHNNLGVALREKGDIEGAIEAYRVAIRLNPAYGVAHRNLGLARKAKGDLDGAIKAFREAIHSDPKSANAYNDLGVALKAKGDLDGAIVAYRESIRLNPAAPFQQNNLGLALWERGDGEGAIAAFRAAIRLNPADPFPQNNLGLALWGRGDGEGAIAAYRAAIRLNPAFGLAHHNLGDLFVWKRKIPEAVAAYREALRHDPKLGLAMNSLAWTLAAGPDGVRNGKEAVELATRVCELTDWKVPEYLDTLAVAHAEAADFEKAIEIQKKTLDFPMYEKAFGMQARKRLALFMQKTPYRDPELQPRTPAPPPREVKK